MSARPLFSLDNEYFLSFTAAVVFLLITGFGVLADYHLHKRSIALIREKETLLTAQAAHAMELWLIEQVLLAQALADAPVVRAVADEPENAHKREELEHFLRSNHMLRPHLTLLNFIRLSPDPNDTITLTAHGKEHVVPPGYPLVDSMNGLSVGAGSKEHIVFSYVKAVYNGMPAFISEAKLNAVPGLPPVFVVAAPVHGKTGRLTGLLSFGVQLKHFNSLFIDDFYLGTTGQMEIIDDRGLVLSSTNTERILNHNYMSYAATLFPKIFQGNHQFIADIEGENFECSVSSIKVPYAMENRWWILFTQSFDDAYNEFFKTRVMVIAVCICLWLLIMISALQIKKKHAIETQKRIKERDAEQQCLYVESAPYGIALLDEHGGICDINPAAGSIFGYSSMELLECAISDLLSPQNECAGGNRFSREAYTGECHGIRRDGKELVVICDWSGDAEKGQHIVFMRDETELARHRRIAEELTENLASALENSEQARNETEIQITKFAAMIEGMAEGVVYTNAEGCVLEANEWICRFMGLTRKDFIGRSLYELHSEEIRDVMNGILKKIRETPGHPLVSFEYRHGQQTFIQRVQPIYHNENLSGVLVNLTEVTELVEARSKAEESTKAKSEFLARMSHEIRTPMNAVLGMAYLALRHDPPEKHKHYLEEIQRSAKNLLVIINNILNFSKIETGKMDIENIPFLLSEQISGIRNIVTLKAKEKNLAFHIQMAPDVPDELSGDPIHLRQILLNLTDNAIKFTARGEIRLEVTLLHESEDGIRLLFVLRDTGIGMEAHQLDRIFEAFQQVDGSTTRHYEGAGIGLAICKRLAELMGGRIWAQSTPGKGSVFHCELRFGKAARVFVRQNAVPGEAELPLPPASVLLVEDNDIDREIGLEMLGSMGLKVDTAKNGLEALAALEEKDYALVLMDIQMPDMDGFETAEKIRGAKNPRIRSLPIVAMTVAAAPEDKEHCLVVGMAGHISKPIDVFELHIVLRRLLSGNADTSSDA